MQSRQDGATLILPPLALGDQEMTCHRDLGSLGVLVALRCFICRCSLVDAQHRANMKILVDSSFLVSRWSRSQGLQLDSSVSWRSSKRSSPRSPVNDPKISGTSSRFLRSDAGIEIWNQHNSNVGYSIAYRSFFFFFFWTFLWPSSVSWMFLEIGGDQGYCQYLG